MSGDIQISCYLGKRIVVVALGAAAAAAANQEQRLPAYLSADAAKDVEILARDLELFVVHQAGV